MLIINIKNDIQHNNIIMAELFIKKARLVHGDRYDYSKVDYKNCNTKVIIICKEHGEFYKKPAKHTNSKQGCTKCSGNYIPTTEEVIEKARVVHGDKFDYSKVKYKNSKEDVIIICKVHGDFFQSPGNHIRLKQGCPRCIGRKKSVKEFIDLSNKKHNNIYDYSKVDYKNGNTKITIICKTHGNFEQVPSSHLNGNGCSSCSLIIRSNKLRKTLEEFIENAMLVHGDRYDYSKVEYKVSNENVTIICKIHGDFEQSPNNHCSQKQGCPKCGMITAGNKNRKSLEEFIENARLIHGDRYDYSKVEYNVSNENVTIICKIHGDFFQSPGNHINLKHGCPKCGIINNAKNKTSNIDEFIKKSRLVHGDKYDYSKVEYKYSRISVIIVCKIHGDFEQIPNRHLTGSGCIECSRINSANKRTSNTDEFIKKSRVVHGDKYDYSKAEYKYSKENVKIICKIHGEFEQTPIAHYNSCRGCPKCSNNGYSKPSIVWLDFLSKLYNINIQHACNAGEYVITSTKYKADGYCKENNTIYEFHGDYWHGNPKVFNPDDINEIVKCTYRELYDKTLSRENKIKELGYNLVTIWENDWKKINKCVKILQHKFRKYKY